jgi:hypothetical protein
VSEDRALTESEQHFRTQHLHAQLSDREFQTRVEAHFEGTVTFESPSDVRKVHRTGRAQRELRLPIMRGLIVVIRAIAIG